MVMNFEIIVLVIEDSRRGFGRLWFVLYGMVWIFKYRYWVNSCLGLGYMCNGEWL